MNHPPLAPSRLRSPCRTGRWLAALPCLALAGLGFGVSAQTTPLERQELSVGFTRSAFLDVNANDAEVAFKAFTRILGLRRGYDVNPSIRVFEDPQSFETAIRSGKTQLIVVDTWTLLSMAVDEFIEPRFVSADAMGRVAKSYVLLSRRERQLDSLGALRGKSLVEYSAPNAILGRHWLQCALQDQAAGAQVDYFGLIERSGKPATVVLPVFFGRRDTCLVDSSSYALMTELNPQVGATLQVVASSEPLLDSVICTSHAGWASEEFKRDVTEVLADLHLEPAGKQVLTLFRIDQLRPFQPEQLAAVKRLFARQKSSGASLAR